MKGKVISGHPRKIELRGLVMMTMVPACEGVAVCVQMYEGDAGEGQGWGGGVLGIYERGVE